MARSALSSADCTIASCITSRASFGSGSAAFLAWTFLLWGLHHLDYPLLRPLGRAVLQTAARQVVEWHRRPGLETLALSVNLSPLQLQQPGFLRRLIPAALRLDADLGPEGGHEGGCLHAVRRA